MPWDSLSSDWLASPSRDACASFPDRSPIFLLFRFEQALCALALASSEALIVGSNVENNIHTSQQTALHGLLVTTGKHEADSPLLAQITPDAVLPRWLEGE